MTTGRLGPANLALAMQQEIVKMVAPGNIQVDETTEAKLRDRYLFEDRGE